MIIKEKTPIEQFGQFVKVVVDVERKIISLGLELHIDCAEELLKDGSASENLWGASVYAENKRIDFVSLINVRPADGNHSMEIQLPEIREKAEAVVKELLF